MAALSGYKVLIISAIWCCGLFIKRWRSNPSLARWHMLKGFYKAVVKDSTDKAHMKQKLNKGSFRIIAEVFKILFIK